jgi:hypothetical protein
VFFLDTSFKLVFWLDTTLKLVNSQMLLNAAVVHDTVICEPPQFLTEFNDHASTCARAEQSAGSEQNIERMKEQSNVLESRTEADQGRSKQDQSRAEQTEQKRTAPTVLI